MATTPKGDNASRGQHLAPQLEQADDRPKDPSRLRDLPGAIPKVSGSCAHVGGEAGAFEKVLQVAQPGHEKQEERRRREQRREDDDTGAPLGAVVGRDVDQPRQPGHRDRDGGHRGEDREAPQHARRHPQHTIQGGGRALEAARRGDQGRIHRSLGTQSPPEHAILLRVARHAAGMTQCTRTSLPDLLFASRVGSGR